MELNAELDELLSDDPTLDITPMDTPTPEPPLVPDTPVEPVVETLPEPPPLEPVLIEDFSVRERALLQQIEDLRAATAPTVGSPTTDTGLPAAEITPPAAATAHDFLAGVDIDEVLSSADGLNKLLQNVYNKSLEDARKLAAEQILRNLPEVVTGYVNQHIQLTETVNDFYRQNPDLAQVKRTVAAVANEVAAGNPGFKLDEVFAEAAKRTRQMLGLRAGTTTPAPTIPVRRSNGATIPPARSAAGRGRATLPALEGIAAEIADLLT